MLKFVSDMVESVCTFDVVSIQGFVLLSVFDSFKLEPNFEGGLLLS